MKEPNWTEVLEYFYQNRETVQYLVGERVSESSDIAESLKLEAHEIDEILNDMEDLGLLDIEFSPTIHGEYKTEMVTYSLSEKGFNVAHDREQNERSKEINQSLVMLTWILAGAALIQAVVAIFTSGVGQQTELSLFSIFILLAVLAGARTTYGGPILPKAVHRLVDRLFS